MPFKEGISLSANTKDLLIIIKNKLMKLTACERIEFLITNENLPALNYKEESSSHFHLIIAEKSFPIFLSKLLQVM